MTIALVDYGAGNMRSVANALAHVGASFEITEDPATVAKADKVVFPGVGAAASCMEALRACGLDEALRSCEQPVLGICLGMQALTDWSTEGDANVVCLGIVPGRTHHFRSVRKLPQIGWNRLEIVRDDPLLAGVPDGEHFYFLHAYRVDVEARCVLGRTDYGGPYPSAIRNGNFWGVQFHPEKSGPYGLHILRNFVERC